MKYSNWSTLKAANKMGFKKEGSNIFLEKKRYSTDTGEEITPSKSLIDLASLESEKDNLTFEKSQIQAELTEVNKMITAIKAL